MKLSFWRLLWFWGPLGLYAALIFYLSSMAHPPVPAVSFPQFDKVLHVVEYSGFGWLLCRGLASGGEGLSARAALLATVLLAALYGASDELHQMFVPPREADPFDLLADVAGSLLGAVCYWALVLRRIPGRRAAAGAPKSP